MRHCTKSAILPALLVLACSSGTADRASVGGAAAREWITTDLGAGCTAWVDPDDPNETVHDLCAGVSGYSLIVRRVGSGRQSIDIVTPDGETLPLALDEYVTRQMATVGDTVEWLVAPADDETIPIALVVRVHAREDTASPETITTTYEAIVRIADGEACVTNRISAGSLSADATRALADSAAAGPCADPLPALPSG